MPPLPNATWSTNFPGSQDTGANAVNQQPTLTQDSSPGANDGHRVLVSHLHSLRNKLQALALKVGDDANLPGGSLLDRADGTDTAISAIQAAIALVEADILSLQGDVTTAQGDITTLQGQMVTAQGDITTLQGDVATAQGDITTLQGEMVTAQGDITTLQGDVSAIQASGLPAERVIEVAQSGRSYTTIASGLLAAAALIPAPSASSPALVLVHPGTYAEVNPLVIPSYVSVVGTGGLNSVTVTPTTATAAIFSLGDKSDIRALQVSGADGVGGIGVSCTAAGYATLIDVDFRDCTTGLYAAGIGVVINASHLHFGRVVGETLTTAISVANQAEAHLFSTHIEGILGTTIGTGVLVDGSGTTVHCFALDVEYAAVGVEINNLGDIWLGNVNLRNGTTAITIGAGAGTLGLSATVVSGYTTHLTVASASSIIRVIGSTLRHDLITIPAGTDHRMFYASDTPGDPSIHLVGNAQTGTEVLPTASSMGQGGSHYRGMSVFTNTNGEAGVWADQTTNAKLLGDLNTFVAFPGVAANNCFYVGGDYAFVGLKVTPTAAIVLGAGAITAEYWNGASWIHLETMSTDSVSPFGQYGENAFARVSTDQVRFGSTTGWATKSLNGTTKYWMRYRITTGITTAPTIDQILLQTSKIKVGVDGTLEKFGGGVRALAMAWHRKLADPISGSAPANQNIVISTNITLVATSNRFSNNTIDSFGGIFRVPDGLDTSYPITLSVFWQSDATAGNIELQVQYATYSEGTVVNGAVAELTPLSVITAVPGIAQTLKKSTFDLDVSTMVPGSFIAIRLYRDATAGNADDTANGYVSILSTTLDGYFWR